MSKKKGIDKNKGLVFFIEGFAGSGKSSIGIKSHKRIIKMFGSTILVHGNEMRDIFNLYGYSRRDRIKSTYKTRKFIKFITEQKINVIYPALCLNYKAKSPYKQKLKNLVEIFIKTDIKKIIENKTKKRIYKLKKKTLLDGQNGIVISIMEDVPQMMKDKLVDGWVLLVKEDGFVNG